MTQQTNLAVFMAVRHKNALLPAKNHLENEVQKIKNGKALNLITTEIHFA